MNEQQTTTVGQLHGVISSAGIPAECAIRLRSASIAFFRLRAMCAEGRGVSISIGHRVDPRTGERWRGSRHGNGIYLAVPVDALIDVVGIRLDGEKLIRGAKFLDMALEDVGSEFRHLSLVNCGAA